MSEFIVNLSNNSTLLLLDYVVHPLKGMSCCYRNNVVINIKVSAGKSVNQSEMRAEQSCGLGKFCMTAHNASRTVCQGWRLRSESPFIETCSLKIYFLISRTPVCRHHHGAALSKLSFNMRTLPRCPTAMFGEYFESLCFGILH